MEGRLLLSSVDPAITAYQSRASQVIASNISQLKSWASSQTGSDNLSTGGLSEWTAAAAFTQSGSDQTAVNDGYLLLGRLMEYRTTHLFGGGNDGWEAWATADTYLRYRSIIQADTARYAPASYATNPNASDGKYSLNDLFQIVLTQSYYGPVDSTSNHVLMNSTACYLANLAFPGQVVKDYNNQTSDPTGANTVLGAAKGIFSSGPAEYGSINYGGYDWQEFLSVYQLTPATGNTALAATCKSAFETALTMNAAYWMNGQLAVSTGRGYPTTGAWGASGGDTLTYVYVGGDYGQTAQQQAYADSTDVKTTAVLAAEAQNFNNYLPPASILHLADPTTHITESNFGGNHQYAYNTEQWSTYSESWKYDAHGPYQSSWRARTIWTKPQDQTYQAVAWVTEPSTNPTANSDGSYNYVNPNTLQAYPLSGSGSYQDSVFEDVSQYQNTQLHVYNIPPVSQEGTPGGQLPVRGAMVYLPIPVITSTNQQAASGNEWQAPVLSSDGHFLFVGYNSCFMAFISSAPFSLGTKVGNSQFYNVFGGPVAGQQVSSSAFIQCAVAQETFSPGSFPGTTLAEQFQNFMNTLSGRQIPKMTVADTYHPIWQYTNGQYTMTNEYVGVTHDNPDNNPGLGEDFLGGPGNSNSQVVDYSKWSLLQETDLSGNVWASLPANGNLNLNVPGQNSLFYDFQHYTTSTGSSIGLTAASNAGGQITLNWSSSLGTNSFKIERSSDDATWTTLNSNYSTTSYTDNTVTQGSFYYYRVTPNGTSIGTSAPVGTAADYNAPASLKLTATTATSATVGWTIASSLAPSQQLQYSIDGYNDQWRYWANLSSTSTSSTANLPNVNSFLDTAPTTANPGNPNNRVFFRVIAYASGPNGTSIYSQPSNIVGSEFSSSSAGDLVSMPQGLSITSTASKQISLAWTDTATNATGYRVERSADQSNWTVLTASLPSTATTYNDSGVTPGTTYYYRVAAINGSTLSPYSQVIPAIAAPPSPGPSIATAASAGLPSLTSVSLAVLGADSAGESSLDYNWSVTAGPGDAVFSQNDTNAAKKTVATFDRPGAYTLTATITDALGLSTTSSVNVTIAPVLTSIAVTPAQAHIPAGATEQLSAVAKDQFGSPLSPQPTITWTTTSGAVSNTGLFTAPASTALAVVSASVGSVYAAASIDDFAAGAAPLVDYSFEEGTGTTALDSSGNGNNGTLSGSVSYAAGIPVAGQPTGGLDLTSGGVSIGNPSDLNFTGAITLSAWINPTSSAGTQGIIEHGYTQNPDAEVFLRINGGTYQVGSWNGNNSYVSGTMPSSDLNTWVYLTGVYDPSQSKWLIYRDGALLASSGTTSQGAVTVNGNWTLGESDNSRYFTGGLDEVSIYNTALSASAVAKLYDFYSNPSFATPATASSLTSTSAKLTALGASAGGESGLKYNWYVIGSAPGTVRFSDNNDNTAKNSTATFSVPGLYHLELIATDANGSSAGSEVDVSVLPAWLSPTSQAVWNNSTLTLNVSGPTTIISDPLTTSGYGPTIIASGANASVLFDPTATSTKTASGLAPTDFHIAGLTLTGGATATETSLDPTQVAAGSAIADHATDHDAIVISEVAGNTNLNVSGGLLNLADNDLIYHYDPNAGGTGLGGASALAAIQGQVANAFDTTNQNWDGTSGITSSAAAIQANNFSGATGLGVIDNNDPNGNQPMTFDQETFSDTNEILVKYTYNGDSDLEGTVNNDGLLAFEQGLANTDSGTLGNTWLLGNYDFSSDGSIGNSELLFFEAGYAAVQAGGPTL
jgi:fibronectin type 3 domain-containing protein